MGRVRKLKLRENNLRMTRKNTMILYSKQMMWQRIGYNVAFT